MAYNETGMSVAKELLVDDVRVLHRTRSSNIKFDVLAGIILVVNSFLNL